MNVDGVIEALKGLASVDTWTACKKLHHAKLLERTRSQELFYYTGRAEGFNCNGLSNIGEVSIFDMPNPKGGKLSAF